MNAIWQRIGVGRACRWALLVSLATGVPVSITRAVLAAPAAAVAEDATVEPPEFTAFLRWLGTYQDSVTAEERAPLEPEGLRLARERRAAMTALIESAPDHALRLAVPAAERAALPAAIAAEVEVHVSGRGRFEVTAVLPTPGPGQPSPTIERRLVTAEQSYRAHGLNRWRKLPYTERVAFHGIALGDAVALADRPVKRLAAREPPNPALPPGNPEGLCPVCGCAARPDLAAEYAGQVLHFAEPDHVVAFSDVVERTEPGLHGAPVALVPTRGPLRVLLIRTVFADQRGAAPISESDARTLGRQVEQFFTDTSHGALSLSLHISPLAVVRGTTRDYPAGSEEILRTDAHAALEGVGIDPEAFDVDVIYSKGSGTRSQAHLLRRGAWVTVNGFVPTPGDVGTVSHELGHQLTLNHAGSWRANDRSILGDGGWIQYGNPFDTMGTEYESISSANYGLFKAFNAFAQHKLGWLPEANLATATTPGIFHLLPVDAPELVAGASHALRLEFPGARTYWIETRAARADLLVQALMSGTPHPEPVLLDTLPGGDGGSHDAPLTVGRSLLDPEAGLRITPRLPLAGAPPGTLDVEVRRVHHGFHEADAGAPEDAQVVELEEATEGRAVHLAGPGQPWAVPVSVPAAGRYLVWLRVKSDAGELALRVAPAEGATLDATAAAAPDWRWVRLAEPPAGDPTNRRPALITLPAGASAIVFEAMSEAWLDLVMLTDDASPNTPPYLATPAPVRLPGDGSAARVSLATSDLEFSGSQAPSLFVSSQDTSLVPAQGLELRGAGVNRELWITARPGELGRTTLRLRAVDGDGNGVSRSLSVSLVGPVQSLVDAAGPGGTVRLPAGVFRDRLELITDITLEGGAAATILDARGMGPGIRVAAGARVTLRDLTLRNGTGGIINEGELILERVTITGMSGTGLDNSGTLFMRDSTLAGNRATDTGAGLRNRGPGDARIENSTFHGNRTTEGNGGGIANEGNLLLIQSTLSGNFAAPKDDEDDVQEEHGGKGGGLYNSGNATLIACTIVNNEALHRGGGLHNAPNGSVVSLYSTILAGNSSRRGAGPDGSGEVQSAGFNLLGDTADLPLVGDLRGNLSGQPARLGPLADNGGPTRTHQPLPDSPALDAGAGADATHDQRGVLRRVDVAGLADAADGTDIGAVEFTPGAPVRVVPAAALDVASGVAVLTLAVRADEAVSGLAFTLHYPPALENPEVLAGPDAAGAVLELDPGVSLPGRLGVRVRFPADRPATTTGRRVLNVVFEATGELHDPAKLRFEFGDEIALRSAADAGGNAVPALFPPFVEATAAAPPLLAVHRQADGRVAVSLTALPGTRYELEATADFEHWEPLGTMDAKDGLAVLDDPGAAAQPHRFYRGRR